MNLYAFELGRKKQLCFAELLSVLGGKNLYEQNLDTAIFKLEKFEAQKLQNQLGGTIKIMKIFATIEAQSQSKDQISITKKIEKALEYELNQTFKDHSGKIPFCINLLSFKNHKLLNIKQLLNFSKFLFKSLGLNSRFLNKNFYQNPKPSMIYKSKTVEKGIDINIINGQKTIYLGKTITIQNIDAYSKRDYNKPKRDAKVGMLPPKLAQIMINLAGPDAKTIYDPFCGTGTILMEGILMEKTVIGSDIDEKMVNASKTNCDWLQEKFANKGNFRLFKKDSRFLTKNDLPEKIDAIVTESHLGEALSRPPSREQKEKIFRELGNLHLNWLNAVNKITPKSCPIITCITAFKIGQKIEELPKFQEIAKLSGYKITKNFIYDRPDQIVARAVKVLEKI